MVPDSTFNTNILVRPRLLFARTRASDRESTAGDFLDELESKKHEIFSPILEEESDDDTSSSDAWMIERRIDQQHPHHHHHHQRRRRRPSVNKMKRPRLLYTSKGNHNGRRQSSDEEDEDEEMTQSSEIDEVDQVEENDRFIRAKHRNTAANARYIGQQGKYISPIKRHRRAKGAGAGAAGFKRMTSKIYEDDDESIEQTEPESFNTDEKIDASSTATESTTLHSNQDHLDSEHVTPSSVKQVTANSHLIPNLLSKSYETYSPDSTSAISGFVSRLRDELHAGASQSTSSALTSEAMKEDEEKNNENNSDTMSTWIPLEDTDYSNDQQIINNHNTGRIKNSPSTSRMNTFKINSRPAWRNDLTTTLDANHTHRNKISTNDSNVSKVQKETSKSAIQSSASSNSNISSAASSLNSIAFQHHLPHMMNDRITERLYSRGLLVYLKDFKYGGL